MFLETDSLRPQWRWLLALGIVMVALGLTALVIMPAATLGTILMLGWLLVVSGIAEMVQAFRVLRWGGLFLHFISGILGVLIGLLVITRPLVGAVASTLSFASFFTVIGLCWLIAAVRRKFPKWGWALFDGVITRGLGSSCG
jgi:uncharacterized membrane protein HdeD (DUF308 family)